MNLPLRMGYYRNCCVFVEKSEPSKCQTSQKAELYGVLLVLTTNSLQILKRTGFNLWKYGNYRIPDIKKCAFGRKKDEENPWTTVLAHIQCSTQSTTSHQSTALPPLNHLSKPTTSLSNGQLPKWQWNIKIQYEQKMRCKQIFLISLSSSRILAY